MAKQAQNGEPVTINQQIACVERELAMRRRVYPDWVRQNKLREEDAAREISQMQAVLDSLIGVLYPLRTKIRRGPLRNV